MKVTVRPTSFCQLTERSVASCRQFMPHSSVHMSLHIQIRMGKCVIIFGNIIFQVINSCSTHPRDSGNKELKIKLDC